ncbi:hypothetical protein F2P81_007890 [Scophthalmus maximus]|uniref:STING ligand-binding domain-containing protein n=1 Tax=Scophthalmus maximus TaxID=52904 RepID=A0A6A4T3F9_SCOMX|nr:hypothetical protein F2P81_007890 [Scophthalmus maximus]
MQCHRDQEEFVLRLRGSLPKVCAAVLVVMTVGGVKFVSPERYRGQGLLSHMLPACGLGGQTLLAAVLAGLLLYLAGNPLLDEGQCWKLVFLVSALYALFKSLGVLASSPRWGRGSRKLLILIPLDSKVSHKIEDEDDNIHFYDNLPNNEIDRAGVRGRVYKHSVYRVRGEHGKAHLCVVEYATPLLTLYNMSHESSAGFGEPERRQQVLLFYRTLRDILENSLQCRNRYKLILLNDEREDDPHFLSKVILRHLLQQEKEEFCLTPPPQQETVHPSASTSTVQPSASCLTGDRGHPEPMSREPTLMISMEKPLPLRAPVENTDYYYRST